VNEAKKREYTLWRAGLETRHDIFTFLSLGGKAESRQVGSYVDCESGRLRMSARSCVVALPSSAYCY